MKLYINIYLMKYLKLFEGVDNINEEKDYILYSLANLVIDQMEEYVKNETTHHTLELASERFSATTIYSIIFGGEDKLIMGINKLFDEMDLHTGDYRINQPNVRLNIKTMNIEQSGSWSKTLYLYISNAYKLLKYCDSDDELKSQLSNWEDIEKYMEKK